MHNLFCETMKDNTIAAIRAGKLVCIRCECAAHRKFYVIFAFNQIVYYMSMWVSNWNKEVNKTATPNTMTTPKPNRAAAKQNDVVIVSLNISLFFFRSFVSSLVFYLNFITPKRFNGRNVCVSCPLTDMIATVVYFRMKIIYSDTVTFHRVVQWINAHNIKQHYHVRWCHTHNISLLIFIHPRNIRLQTKKTRKKICYSFSSILFLSHLICLQFCFANECGLEATLCYDTILSTRTR